MSSATSSPHMQSAAWRVSLWGTFAFAFGTLVVFVFFHQFVTTQMEHRNDRWLRGQASILAEIVERTPRDRLYEQIVITFAQLVRNGIHSDSRHPGLPDDEVFFMQEDPSLHLMIWVGPGEPNAAARAIGRSNVLPDQASNVYLPTSTTPYRVVSMRIEDGSRIFLGLSEFEQIRIMHRSGIVFSMLWLTIVLLGFSVIFITTRNPLRHIQGITEAASKMQSSDLTTRVPLWHKNDEVAQLATTLNRMLDRIHSSIQQLHLMADSLAHDMRTPLTAVRMRLEESISAPTQQKSNEIILSAIEVLDRLNEFVKESLEIAESRADALRVCRSELRVNDLIEPIMDLYRPMMDEKSLSIQFDGADNILLSADPALLNRVFSNLLDNAVMHVPPQHSISIRIIKSKESLRIVVEDDGPGFPPELLDHVFDRHVRSSGSGGHGLGLAFVDAVIRAHGAAITASNRDQGGSRIQIVWPRNAWHEEPSARPGTRSS